MGKNDERRFGNLYVPRAKASPLQTPARRAEPPPADPDLDRAQELRTLRARRAQPSRATQAPGQPVRPRLARQWHDRRRQTTPSIPRLLQGNRPSQTETPE